MRARPAVEPRLGECRARPHDKPSDARERQPALQTTRQRLPRGPGRRPSGIRRKDPDLARAREHLRPQHRQADEPAAHAHGQRDPRRSQRLPAVVGEGHRRRERRQRCGQHGHGGERGAVEEPDRPGRSVACPDLGDLRTQVGRDLAGQRRGRRLQRRQEHLADVGQLDADVALAAQQDTVRDHDGTAHHPRELPRPDDGLHRGDDQRTRGDEIGRSAFEHRHHDLFGDHRLDRVGSQRAQRTVGERVGIGELQLDVARREPRERERRSEDRQRQAGAARHAVMIVGVPGLGGAAEPGSPGWGPPRSSARSGPVRASASRRAGGLDQRAGDPPGVSRSTVATVACASAASTTPASLRQGRWRRSPRPRRAASSTSTSSACCT
jgi:hypothetical protein